MRSETGDLKYHNLESLSFLGEIGAARVARSYLPETHEQVSHDRIVPLVGSSNASQIRSKSREMLVPSLQEESSENTPEKNACSESMHLGPSESNLKNLSSLDNNIAVGGLPEIDQVTNAQEGHPRRMRHD